MITIVDSFGINLASIATRERDSFWSLKTSFKYSLLQDVVGYHWNKVYKSKTIMHRVQDY